MRQSRPERVTRSCFLLERPVSDQVVPVVRTRQAAHRRSILQRLQSPEFRSSGFGVRGNSGQAFHADRIRSAQLPDFAADGTARRRVGRRQFTSDDCIPGATGVLNCATWLLLTGVQQETAFRSAKHGNLIFVEHFAPDVGPEFLQYLLKYPPLYLQQWV